MGGTTMSTPALRLFAVFWWLLAIVSAGIGIGGSLIAWEGYHSSAAYTAYRTDQANRPAWFARMPVFDLPPGVPPMPPGFVLEEPPVPPGTVPADGKTYTLTADEIAAQTFFWDYPNPLPKPSAENAWVATVALLLFSVLPFTILTLIRWIITARWRLGPRW